MNAGGYLAGSAVLIVALGSTGFTGWMICRRRLPYLEPAPRAVAMALLSMGALGLAVLIPGALTILTRGTFVGCAVMLAAASALIPGGAGAKRRDRWAVRPGPAVVISTLAAVVVGAWLLGELAHLLTKPSQAVDFTSYDLPIIARWIQSGTVWHITELFPLQTHGTYPQTANLVLAAFVLPFHNDAFVGLVPCLALVITGLSAFAAARELRAPPTVALACAAMLCGLPTIAWEILTAPPDAVALAAFTGGFLFLLRHARSRLTSDLIMAGLGLGLAAGSLWYFSSAVALVAVVWVIGAFWPGGLAGSEGWPHSLKRAAILLGTVALVSGFWLVRNLVETGDPFYPVRIAVAGHTIFAAPPDLYRAVSGFSIAHYAGDLHALSHYIAPALAKTLGLPGAVVLLGLAVAMGGLVRGFARGRRPPGVAVLLLVTSLLLFILYVLTPYSAFGPRGVPLLAWVNVRYLTPAIAVAMPLVAATLGSVRRRLRLLGELALCAAAIQGVHEAYAVIGPSAGLVAIGLGLELALLGGAWSWSRHGRGQAVSIPWRYRLAGTALVLLVGVGYATQRQLNDSRYASYDPTFAWVQKHPAPLRVGLAGSFDFVGLSPAWPMFGERIQNTVSFVGELRKGHLTQYTSRRDWIDALRRGHYDVVEIAIDRPPPFTGDQEPAWARESGLRVLARSSRFELVRPSS